MDDKSKILEFAKSHNLCVIATSVDNIPESAIVDFVITNDLEIIFNTFTTSKKYKNLKINPNVALVIGFGNDLKTLQCEGIAIELEGHDKEKVMSAYGDNMGFFRRWKIKDMKYFRVIPKWMRLSDFSDFPPKEIKLNFKDQL